jgi:HEAT repeat protein
MPNRTQVLRAFLAHCRGLSSWIRERSITSIQKLAGGLGECLATLLQDPDEEIRVGAVMLAGPSNDPRLLPHLRAIFLGQSDWWVRSMAANVIANFPAQQVLDLLLSRIDDRDLRYSVIHALGRMRDEVVIPHLLQCLSDAQRGIRSATLDALKDSRRQDVFNALVYLGRHDREEGIREKALVMLRALGPAGERAAAEIERAQREPAGQAAAPAELAGLEMANDVLNA